MFLILLQKKQVYTLYQTLTFVHSITRWLVLVSLLYSIYIAYRGNKNRLPFTATANAVRHWTATIAHIQLVIGIALYMQSPIIKYFWQHFGEAVHDLDNAFFGIIHISLMLVAIVIITMGSAMAKRKDSDHEKYRTMLLWFSLALLVIFIAIPWPFSPLASRPYLR